MLTATLTIPEALQVIVYLDTMQANEEDPLHSLGETIEEALRQAGLGDDAIYDVESDEDMEDKALEKLVGQIEIQEGAEPEAGSVTFTITDREEDALLAVAI